METKNLDIYGSEPIPWSRTRDAFAASHGPGVAFFLGTVRPDGTPHAAGIGAVRADDRLWFVTGPRTRKARNLAANPACTIPCRLPGIDVVLEGRAERRSRRPTARRAPGRRRGTSTASRSTPCSALRPPSRTGLRAGGSMANGDRRGG